jgi:hypothetical protein
MHTITKIAAVAALFAAPLEVHAHNIDKKVENAVNLEGQDGLYAVKVTTGQGDCDRVYNWMILVTGGRVSSAGDTPLNASGQIDSRGVVNVRFQRFGQVANVTGRVAGGSGSGTWISPTLQCSGSWRASRRGPAGQ